jgi:hypothetical protein
MKTIYHDLVILIIAFTCVGLFIATAIASTLDLFNWFKLAPDIRAKLHSVLVIEIVGICVAIFGGFLNPKPIAEKVQSQKVQLEKQIADSTREIKRAEANEDVPTQNEVVVDFPWVDTASAPGNVVAASPYLHGLGISVTNQQPQESELVLINNRALYQGRAVRPTTSQNMLTQFNTNNGFTSFTLRFSEPFASVRVVRPALYPNTTSGITHPAWSVHALDSAGREISSQTEELTRSFSDVPAHTYTLTSFGLDNISAVRFDSDPRWDGRPFAAFSAVLIERITLTRRGNSTRQ